MSVVSFKRKLPQKEKFGKGIVEKVEN